jgi:hypothetical protein
VTSVILKTVATPAKMRVMAAVENPGLLEVEVQFA